MTYSNPDPRNLIAEAFRMDGLNPPECRSIFLDWMLGLPADADARRAVRELLDRHAAAPPTHPMHEVLRRALDASPAPRRRGGRRGRAS